MNKKLTMLTVVAVMAGLISFHGVARAATIFVDLNGPSCPGPGSGTFLDPYCTIELGITNANAGDTIDIAAGTYVPDGSLSGTISTLQTPFVVPADIVIPTAKSSITIQGNPGAVIDMSTRTGPPGFQILFGIDGPGFSLQDIAVVNPLRVVVAGAVGSTDATLKADDLTVQRVNVTYAAVGLPVIVGTNRGLIFSATSVFDQTNVGFTITPTTGMQILDNVVDSSVTPSINGIDLRGHLDGAIIQGNTLINYADAIISNNFGGGLQTFNSFNLSFLDNNITMPDVDAGEFFEGGDCARRRRELGGARQYDQHRQLFTGRWNLRGKPQRRSDR